MARHPGQKRLLYLTAKETADLYQTLFQADFPDKTYQRALNHIVSTINQYGSDITIDGKTASVEVNIQPDMEKPSLTIPCEIAELICLLIYLESKSKEYRIIARSEEQEKQYQKANVKQKKVYKSSKSKEDLSKFTIEKVFTFAEIYESAVNQLNPLTRHQLNKAFSQYFADWSALTERYHQLKKFKQRFLAAVIKIYNADGQHPYMNAPDYLREGKQIKECTRSDKYISHLSEACENLLAEIYSFENRRFHEIQSNFDFIMQSFFRNNSLKDSIERWSSFSDDVIKETLQIPASDIGSTVSKGNVYQKILEVICTRIKTVYYLTNDDRNFRHRRYDEIINKEKLSSDEKSFLAHTQALSGTLFERPDTFVAEPKLKRKLKNWVKEYLDMILKVQEQLNEMEKNNCTQ